MKVIANMTMEEEETRSVTAPEPKALQGDLSAQFNYLCTTNNFFEMGTSSLLVDSGVRHGGLFGQGDRFIPVRPEETPFAGTQ